jgi:hypothetical protein
MTSWRLNNKRMREPFPWKGKEEVKMRLYLGKGPQLSLL